MLLRAWLRSISDGLNVDGAKLEKENRRSDLYYLSKRQLKLELEDRFAGVAHVGVHWDNNIPKVAIRWPPKNQANLDFLIDRVLESVCIVLGMPWAKYQKMEFRMGQEFHPSQGYSPVVAILVGKHTVYLEARKRRSNTSEFDGEQFRNNVRSSLNQPTSGRYRSL